MILVLSMGCAICTIGDSFKLIWQRKFVSNQNTFVSADPIKKKETLNHLETEKLTESENMNIYSFLLTSAKTTTIRLVKVNQSSQVVGLKAKIMTWIKL